MSGDIGPNRSKYTHILRKKKTHIDELARQDWERPPFQWSIVPQGREGRGAWYEVVWEVLGGSAISSLFTNMFSDRECFCIIQSMHSLRGRSTQNADFRSFLCQETNLLLTSLTSDLHWHRPAFEIQEGDTMLFGQMWPDTDISKVKWTESAQRDREHLMLQVVCPLWVLC